MNLIELKPDEKVGAPGLYVMTAAQYHADPCPEPSLSSSILNMLLNGSPAHAHYAHPRLGNGVRPDSSKASEIGSAVHKLALGKGAEVVIIDAADYRTKAAQEARATAIAAGKIPILNDDHDNAVRLAMGMYHAAEAWLGLPMEQCLREVVVVWVENGFWRRAMVDVMTPDLQLALDLKSTSASAAPEEAIKRVYAGGYDVQRAHYVNGLDALDPDGRGRRKFGFLFGETEEPCLVGPVLELSEAGITLGEQQRKIGTAIWDACLESGKWPGYSQEPMIAEPPPWKLGAWEYRMQNDSTLNPQE